MSAVHILPKEVEKAFGFEGSEKFVQFLNEAFDAQKGNVIQIVSDRFEKRVTEENAKVRTEIAEFKSDVTNEFAKVRTEIAEFKSDVTNEFAKVRTEIAEFKVEVTTDFAKVRTEIADFKVDVTNDFGKVHVGLANLDGKISSLRGEVKSDLFEVYKAISSQTRWILVALIGGATIYPIIAKLIDKLLP